MPSQDTKFIYEQPCALVKKFLGVLKAINNWLTADGQNDAHTGICTLHEMPNLLIKDMKTNKSKTHRERQNVGS